LLRRNGHFAFLSRTPGILSFSSTKITPADFSERMIAIPTDLCLQKSGEATFDSMIEDGRFDVIGPIDLLLVSIASDLLNLSGSHANA
jgi:hypothetical protein